MITPTRTISNREIVLLTRQLGAMIGSGLTITRAIRALAEHCANTTLRDTLQAIERSIREGQSLASALGNHPTIFKPYYIALVSAGERSGKLEEAFSTLTRNLETRYALRKRLLTASLYPALVFATLFLVTIFLLAWVVPSFEDLFSDSSTPLPLLTQYVLTFSRGMVAYGPSLLIASIVIIATCARVPRTRRIFLSYRDYLVLTLPLCRTLFRASYAATISDALASLIRSGIPIVESLSIAATICQNKLIQKDILSLRTLIANGFSLSESFGRSTVFPHMLYTMLAVGEESGQLDSMLSKAATFFENEANGLVEILKQAIEPCLMLLLGLIVGVLVLAMYLPIFQLGEAARFGQ